MQKSSVVVILFISSLLFFISCKTTSISKIDEGLTPENSVVMIFINHGDFDLVQVNPEYPEDRISVSDSAGCTTPMIPGSCYITVCNFEESEIYLDKVGIPCIEDSLPFAYLNAKQTDEDLFRMQYLRGKKIIIPTEPGLYVNYCFSRLDALTESGMYQFYINSNSELAKKNIDLLGFDDIEKWKKNPKQRKQILNRFKKCLKFFEGSSWQDLIQNYVTEWSSEN